MKKQKKYSSTNDLSNAFTMQHRLTVAAMSSFCLLGVLGFSMLCPFYQYSASAEGEVIDGAQTPMSLTVAATVSVSLTEFPSLSITPTTAGATGADTTTLRVSTTSSNGYQIFMRTADGKATLQNPNGGEVNPVSGTTTLANFPNNTWGYALGKGINKDTVSYKAVSTNTNSAILTANSSSTGVANDSYTLAFGAKINTSIPAGEYKNNVVVSVIATPMPEPDDINKISTMQEMTAEICENTVAGDSKNLTDTRNNKSYTVFKAKDNNCWMRDDLMIDGTVEKANVTGGTNGTYNLTSYSNYWNTNNTYYYTATAATASTIGMSANGTSSICPTGGESNANWVLPKAAQSGQSYTGPGSFAALLNAYGGATPAVATSSELNFEYKGFVNSSGQVTSTDGYYWTRSPINSMNIYTLYFSQTTASTAYSNTYNYGEPIRCLYPSTTTKSMVQAQ